MINSIKFNREIKDRFVKLSNQVIGCFGKNSVCRVVRVEIGLYKEGMRGKKVEIVNVGFLFEKVDEEGRSCVVVCRKEGVFWRDGKDFSVFVS